MRYLLNSAVATSFGSYEYEPMTEEQAKEWLHAGPWFSTIGYPETAAALAALTGIAIPVNRKQISMQAGDEALVFRLVLPAGTPRLDPADKGRLTPEFIRKHAEIGLLTKVSSGVRGHLA